LKPVADSLSELYTDDEDFANGALMIVHQIPYEETTPAKYPLETMADDKGDCDLFACIAASIMKAGGLNVVLLHYKEEEHMNLGSNKFSSALFDEQTVTVALPKARTTPESE
jgi:hypothetical protein